jgi:hypothetical protein
MRRPLLAFVPVCALAVGATGCGALGGSPGGSSAAADPGYNDRRGSDNRSAV